MDRNIIAKNTVIIGDIKADGDFRIDGSLEGNITTKGRVIIGLEGSVKGAIKALNADVEGTVSGKLQVNHTLTVKAKASISGEVITGKLSVEPGAIFEAVCSMKSGTKELNQTNEKTKKTAS